MSTYVIHMRALIKHMYNYHGILKCFSNDRNKSVYVQKLNSIDILKLPFLQCIYFLNRILVWMRIRKDLPLNNSSKIRGLVYNVRPRVMKTKYEQNLHKWYSNWICTNPLRDTEHKFAYKRSKKIGVFEINYPCQEYNFG